MASSLTDILKQEYKSKGLIGGTTSALGKSAKEKLDIRNAIFGGSGLGSVVGRKVFGKGYSAISDRQISKSDSGLSGSSSILQEMNINSQISAKNSTALPKIAFDMNIMKQNIIKLVKAQGITPAKRGDMYFQRAKEREGTYEAMFGKKAAASSPTKIKEEKSGLTGILGLVTSLFTGLAAKMGSFGGIISGVITTIASLGLLLAGAVRLVMGAISILPGGKLLLKGLKIGALAVGGLAAFNAFGKDNGGEQSGANSGGERSFLDRAGQAVSGGVGAAVGVAGIKGGMALGKRAPSYEMRNGTIAEKGGKMVKATNVGNNATLGKKLEQLRAFSVKITKRKQGDLFFKMISKKLGRAIAFRCVTLFASFAAAPFTVGFSLLITIASAIMLAFEIASIYDAIFGKDGIDKALDAVEEGKNKAPSLQEGNMTFEEALFGAFEAALGIQDSPAGSAPAPTPTPAADNYNKLSQNAKAGAGFDASGGASNAGGAAFGNPNITRQGAKNKAMRESQSPSAIPANGSSDSITFNQLTKEQQDAVLLAQRNQEGFKPGSLTYDLNNPGAMLYSSWQKKFGGELDATGRGVGSVKGKFARFPTLQDGIEAQRALLSGTNGAPTIYANLPLDKAINQWVTGNKDSDVDVNMGPQGQKITGYKKAVFEAAGVTTGAKVSAASSAASRPVVSSGGNQTTNNIISSGGKQTSSAVTAANPYDAELAKMLTTRMAGG